MRSPNSCSRIWPNTRLIEQTRRRGSTRVGGAARELLCSGFAVLAVGVLPVFDGLPVEKSVDHRLHEMIAHGSTRTNHHLSFDDEFGQMSDGKDGEQPPGTGGDPAAAEKDGQSAADVKNPH